MQACATFPSQAVQEYNRAVQLQKAGDRVNSSVIYQEILKSWPTYDKARYNLILLQIENKDYILAEENLTQLKKRKPNNISVGKLQAYLLYLQGKEEESLCLYQSLIERVPLDVEVLHNLAYLLWHLRRDRFKSDYYLRRLKFIQLEDLFKDKEWVKELERIR